MKPVLETVKNRIHRIFEKVFPQGMPRFSQWRMLFFVMSIKERWRFLFFFGCFLIAGTALFVNFYLRSTIIIPEYGGEYIEGIVGQPRYINPLYGMINDTDRDLVQLTFSGVMTYDINGKIIPDLAKNYKISEDGLVYDIVLKDNLYWTDNEKLTADDVIYTINIIQDPDYKSPLRAGFIGVTIKKISETEVRFILQKSYAPFLEGLTVKILPRHIWENITAQNFPLSSYNLSPIGSGPYQLTRFNRDKDDRIQSVVLIANKKYHRKSPYIEKLTIKFFDNENALIGAAKKGSVHGYSLSFVEKQKVSDKSFHSHQLAIPRYFALFLNGTKATALGDKNVRQALNYATNKKDIVTNVLSGEGQTVNSPIMPEIYGFASIDQDYNYNQDKAKEIFDKAGYTVNAEGVREKISQGEISTTIKSELKLGSQGTEVRKLQECLLQPSIGGDDMFPNGSVSGFYGSETEAAVILFQEKYAKEILEPQGLKKGTGTVSKSTRTKLNDLCPIIPAKISALKFTIITVDQPSLIEIAKNIKQQWETVDIKTEIKIVDVQSIERDVIKPRNYEVLLFGEVLGAIPDPFPFWHSSQKKDPGLNLAVYDNKKVDGLLEDARSAFNDGLQQKRLEAFQNAIVNDAPVVFLYRPNYIYRVDKNIKGIIEGKMIVNPSMRFLNIENWHLNTKRIWQ